ncbi:hypothetical protein AGABI2DRAFT_146705 [Agaricus bisporus var. bisporus H97]|uniref:hypothetical protein n=1 Tax=Agaricus bisporus var. bisporus (strain H97 / ATCC MYA-4626 / FGSC 10389) TaxID=936046 RepID=UPI00029F7015|nr:hypothetical protein AGABI2DRAFT_146705 [Agaricus bisporus var. bisporus H97]EKV42202.1 hypothetical protein AGABI2DRAFT_146705 [Agaricus bisporus var. bisporus H97]
MQSEPTEKPSHKVRCTCGCGKHVAYSTRRAHIRLQTRTGVAASSIEQFGLGQRPDISIEVQRKRRRSVLTDEEEQPNTRRFVTPEIPDINEFGVGDQQMFVHQGIGSSAESIVERNQLAINTRWGTQNDIQAIEDSSDDGTEGDNENMRRDERDYGDDEIGVEGEESGNTSEDRDEEEEEDTRTDTDGAGSVIAGTTQTSLWNDDAEFTDVFPSAGSSSFATFTIPANDASMIQTLP